MLTEIISTSLSLYLVNSAKKKGTTITNAEDKKPDFEAVVVIRPIVLLEYPKNNKKPTIEPPKGAVLVIFDFVKKKIGVSISAAIKKR